MLNLNLFFLFLLIIIPFIIYLFNPIFKGYWGEKKVSFLLSLLNKKQYTIINNVLLKSDDKTAQIDHLVVSNFGIFVIETKNYKGWIFGDENSYYWTQVLFKRKYKLYNPIRQNNGHVKALKHYLRSFPQIKYIPIVVFSSNSTLKVSTDSIVIYTMDILNIIKSFKTPVITEKERQIIIGVLNYLNSNNRVTKNEFKKLQKINNKKIESKINQKICPSCGGNLKTKHGKFGKFIGCDNFPQCKFTSNI